MPRARRPWFRFYTEAIHDRKLRRIPPTQRWVWVVVLALARQSPLPGYLLLADDGNKTVPLDFKDISDAAAVKPSDVRAALKAFEDLGMIEKDPNMGAMKVRKWNDRQFESDDVTERTRQHRSKEQRRNDAGNVPTTLQGTSNSVARARAGARAETETETEQDPPNPTLPRGESSATGDKTKPRNTATNPRAKGTNPRAVAKRGNRTAGAQSRGRTLALGGSSRIDALAAIGREYHEPELAAAAVEAYDQTVKETAVE